MSFNETDPQALYFWTLGVHTVGAVWFFFFFLLNPVELEEDPPTPGDS